MVDSVHAMPRETRHRRVSLYVLTNVAFVSLVGVGCVAGGFPDPRWLYLILLFGLCSTSVIDLDGFNGRYALLAFFMAVYFVSFGAVDLSNLLTGGGVPESASAQHSTNFMDSTEAVILIGAVMLALGYRLAVFLVSTSRPTRTPREWSKLAILTVGLIFWTLGTIVTYRWYVYIVTDVTNEATRKGLSSLTTATLTFYLLCQMCGPLGMLLIAYAWSVFRSAYLLALLITMVILQIFLGFVVDVKGFAMTGIILVIVTSVLVGGRLPKAWLAAGLAFVVLIYPYFTAYRGAIHGAGISRTAVLANFGEVLKRTIAAKEQINTGRDRAQTFLERSNVKGSVDIIVRRAGNGVAFQGGYTLSPILEAFIPKIIWSDKAAIPTGQLFNKQFHIVDSDDIFVSPSHLGELYWNFGWPGVVLGMTFIGAICGWIGARFNLADYRTVTRLLVTVITIKQLIVVFESSIADCYVVWLRSIAGIGILHLIFARVPVVSRFFGPKGSPPGPLGAGEPHAERLFPNLLS